MLEKEIANEAKKSLGFCKFLYKIRPQVISGGIKPELLAVLRRTGGAQWLDNARFVLQKTLLYRRNRAFRQKYPHVTLPPDYLMYESFRLDYEKYYEGGKETARWLAGYFARYKPLENLHVLDWGCGPGRLIRHLPTEFGRGCSFAGTDYNAQSIAWCRVNIPNIQFAVNELEPPTAFDTASFDVIYGISILTHLSYALHEAWLRELLRLAKPGALLLLTTHGDAFLPKLTVKEQRAYQRGELVVRNYAREGHRVFAAFHPPNFMRAFFETYTAILEHIPGEHTLGKPPAQDVWILQKM